MSAEEAHLYWNGTFSEAQKKSFFVGADSKYISTLLRDFREPSNTLGNLNRFLSLDQHCYLPDDILYKSDRMSMAHSVELRPPFLDHRLVEFAASLPEKFKISGSRQKYLLRELMKHKLPKFILQRKKIGLDIPTHDWLRGVLRPMLLDTLTPGAIKQTELFRADVIQSFIQDHMERRANVGFHLWGLMILFLWMKKWKIQATPFAEVKREPLEKVLTFT
jgi:asparagine synthase (glutamine-hydrolysing)